MVQILATMQKQCLLKHIYFGRCNFHLISQFSPKGKCFDKKNVYKIPITYRIN